MSIEEALRHYVRAYEEVMLIDYSAGLFNQHARHGQLTLAQLHSFLSFDSHGATTKVFRIFDEDGSGTIDAHEFHKVVRYLNFTDGYCDACDAPILEHQHSFYCTSCDNYLLCVGCHGQRQRVHNSRHQFRLMCDKESLKEYMPGVGNFLRAEIEQLFRELDADRSGKVTHGEFRVYFRRLGFREALIDHFLQLDLNGDGYLDKNELLCIMVAIRITRFCDECGDWEFPGSGNMLSCIQCTADYDVCRSCFQSGRCSHEHEHFETVSMLQLRRLGLCLEVNGNDRRVVCEDQEK
jgi:Ca2+-binding EF-hand superfamily protein